MPGVREILDVETVGVNPVFKFFNCQLDNPARLAEKPSVISPMAEGFLAAGIRGGAKSGSWLYIKERGWSIFPSRINDQIPDLFYPHKTLTRNR